MKRPHSTSPAALLAGGMSLFILACGVSHMDMTSNPDRPAENTPERFVFDLSTAGAPPDTIPGEGCRNPMFDPRDGVRLTLIRSGASRGDYDVPAGRYGVRANELLRLACNTGHVVGIVRR